MISWDILPHLILNLKIQILPELLANNHWQDFKLRKVPDKIPRQKNHSSTLQIMNAKLSGYTVNCYKLLMALKEYVI